MEFSSLSSTIELSNWPKAINMKDRPMLNLYKAANIAMRNDAVPSVCMRKIETGEEITFFARLTNPYVDSINKTFFINEIDGQVI